MNANKPKIVPRRHRPTDPTQRLRRDVPQRQVLALGRRNNLFPQRAAPDGPPLDHPPPQSSTNKADYISGKGFVLRRDGRSPGSGRSPPVNRWRKTAQCSTNWFRQGAFRQRLFWKREPTRRLLSALYRPGTPKPAGRHRPRRTAHPPGTRLGGLQPAKRRRCHSTPAFEEQADGKPCRSAVSTNKDHEPM